LRFDRVLTVDGASATGKTELLRGLHSRFGCTVLEVGVLFRTVAWLVHARRVSATVALGFLDRSIHQGTLALGYAGDSHIAATSVVLSGQDVTDLVMDRLPDSLIAYVSRDERTVAWVYAQVRRLVAGEAAAVSGRHVALHVCPEAGLRLRLEADFAERRRRKLHQIRCRDPLGTWLDDAVLLGNVDGATQTIDTTVRSASAVLDLVAAQSRSVLGWSESGDRRGALLAA
jgi:cytidylate kinase